LNDAAWIYPQISGGSTTCDCDRCKDYLRRTLPEQIERTAAELKALRKQLTALGG
jgi:hypothetical protein